MAYSMRSILCAKLFSLLLPIPILKILCGTKWYLWSLVWYLSIF